MYDWFTTMLVFHVPLHMHFSWKSKVLANWQRKCGKEKKFSLDLDHPGLVIGTTSAVLQALFNLKLACIIHTAPLGRYFIWP